MDTARERTRARQLAVVALAAVALGAVALAVGAAVRPDVAVTGVETRGDRFHPTDVVASSGGRIEVRNDDAYAHTFTVVDLDVDVYIGPASTRAVKLPRTAAGTYALHCRVPGHEDMVGSLVVR